jgi:hypothetical protein
MVRGPPGATGPDHLGAPDRGVWSNLSHPEPCFTELPFKCEVSDGGPETVPAVLLGIKAEAGGQAVATPGRGELQHKAGSCEAAVQ